MTDERTTKMGTGSSLVRCFVLGSMLSCVWGRDDPHYLRERMLWNTAKTSKTAKKKSKTMNFMGYSGYTAMKYRPPSMARPGGQKNVFGMSMKYKGYGSKMGVKKMKTNLWMTKGTHILIFFSR